MFSLPELPLPILTIIQNIKNAGGQAYVVGGALRDLLLGATPKDWDLATTLLPKQILQLYPESRSIGGNCGTVLVRFPGGSCEITPCRTEGAYSDHRHPDHVQFIPDIFADLSRRDFTINAMAYDGEILLDPFGGQKDLKNHLLRCVGEPVSRFTEDPLRILRLYRFSATLGFTAEWNTFCSANELTHLISYLSPERVRNEMQTILYSDNPQVLSPFIARGGLCDYGFSFAPALTPLKEIPKNGLCRWWGLISLCGADFRRVGKAFGFSRKDMAILEEYTRLYRIGPSHNRTDLKSKLKNSKIDYAPAAASFAAISPVFAGEPVLFAEIKVNKEPYRIKDLAINGDILHYEGIKGRRCGYILDELLAAVIKNPALNRPQILLGMARGMQKVI